ncbi:MAG TPA: proline--tRNA ligase [Firmicutes bacterium]|nr:proline--tRNA ligase [Bacillota bacterium]
MEEDFPRWYTDVILKAELVDYSSIKGCMVIRPYGYEIWERIQAVLDRMFKETGHKNVYFPLFIPESLLNKEKEHVEGFAPEVAWVTMGGSEKLEERLCVRPTSETLFSTMYAKWVGSWRDLPMLYNQWCNVVRWEKTTRPFLRTSEFLWQEGHTVHETQEESQEETIRMLNIYAEFAEKYLAIPVIKGKKTEKEKFAGAVSTYTIEAMMHDGKALQSGTSHNFGQNFSVPFDIKFQNREGKLEYCWQTSWGVSTRLIGAIIMVHGDNRGLVLPPRIAPLQVIMVPVAQHKPGVLDVCREVLDKLKKNYRVQMDERDNYSVGWKFNEWEMKGVPIRLEIGPKDIEKNQAVLVRRDTGEKTFVSLERIEEEVGSLLEQIQDNLFQKALKNREERTQSATNMEEFISKLEKKQGFIRALWCGKQECEETIKEKTGATARCIPFEQEETGGKCVCCGEQAQCEVIFARAY